MSDHIHIEQGALPWRPSQSSEVQCVFHEFTIPLVGVVEQHGVSYLFWCVIGHAAPEHAWAYSRIDPEQVEYLQGASAENFDERLREVVGDGASSFAIASDDKGVIESVILEPSTDFVHAHERGMTEVGQKFQEVLEEFQHLMETFPLIRRGSQFGIRPTPLMPEALVK